MNNKKKQLLETIQIKKPNLRIMELLKKPIDLPFLKKKTRSSTEEDQLLVPSQEPLKHKWWEIEFGKPVPDLVLLQVTRQLSAFTSAGVPILESIGLLVKSVKHKRMNIILGEIAVQIRNGVSLSEAVNNFPRIFPKYYVAILEASESSGDLAATFETLTSYIERDFTAKRSVKSAIYYPAILVVVSIIAIFILSVVVLPKFEIFFNSLNTELPLPTRILLNFSSFMAHFWWAVISFFLLFFVIIFFYNKTIPGKYNLDKLVLRIPILGELIELILLERFSRILGSLSSAGVPLPEGLVLAGKALSNSVYTRAIEKTSAGVMQGKGFVEPLEETKVFPDEATLILRVGEQSGRLVQQLNYSSEYYSKEVDYRLKNIATLIEPVILVIVGGGVGFVAIALVSAMYGIYSSSALGG